MYKPYPRIYIACEREAYKGIEDESLRITFDKDIRFRENDLSLTDDTFGKRIINDNQYLMEIKAEGAMPVWLSNIINSMNIYPQSFSKYGYCYKTFLGGQLHKRKQENRRQENV